MGKKVLFIEDEPELVDMYRIRFEKEGLEFISAEDGEEGLDKLTNQKPDLVILDLILPKIDGYAIIRTMKASRELNKIPIIVLSGSGSVNFEKKCLDLGVNYALRKPCDSGELVSRIKELLG
ncbi:response regulator transcription factor [Candidatus Omnitrophota bacterium]